ncbi:MAG: hypothetical protein U0M02_13910 [Acutalibacteraceae bacterium]|nr:hypothetical protein [Acutalibacteraceae bacterium]
MTKKEQKYIKSLKDENDGLRSLLIRFMDAVGKLTNIDDVVNMSLIPIMTEKTKRFKAEFKAEAYKGFAERSEKEIFIKQEDERKQMLKILKTYRGTRNYSDTEQSTDNWLRAYGEAVQDILGVFNNLLNELVGDENRL